jgi:hypothetical protein
VRCARQYAAASLVRIAAGVVVLTAAATALGAPAAPPSARQIRAETREAVAASGARLRFLELRMPNRRYDLRVGTQHSAAYLKHRAPLLADVVTDLTNNRRVFQFVRFVIYGPSGPVFWVTVERAGPRAETRWFVLPSLEDCARDIGGFDIEIDPDRVGPPCPVR